MKKFVVSKRSTEINSYKVARAAYEGMTIDEKLNRLDITPDEEHVFENESEAKEYLNSQSNDYFYNGSGYGWAKEWWLEEVEVDEDGDIEDSYGMDICPNSNLDEFLARIKGEDEEDE